MSDLPRWTGGLVGERDPAQPLLTLLDGPARVELSGATTANWVAKTSNLLVDGLGGPARVGLLLPLHWQTVVLLLAGVATSATVVVARTADELAACEVAFSTADDAPAVLDAGVDEVLVVSTSPLGAPGPPVAAPLVDHAREVPSYGDTWTGRPHRPADVVVAGEPLGALPALDLTAADRVLVAAAPADPTGLRLLLGALARGAAVVLAPAPDLLPAGAVEAERVTASVGVDRPGVRRLG